MSRSDTLMLLQECSSGIKTAIASIDDVLPFVKESEFKQVLKESKTEHKSLEQKINGELEKINAPAKEPGIMAKSMSKVKINAELAFKPTSAQAASLITDGCSMGIKTITRCLNQYPAADSSAKKLAEKGYSEKFGARNLYRTIVSLVENPVAEDILRGGESRKIIFDESRVMP